jgi:hypothetical protein
VDWVCWSVCAAFRSVRGFTEGVVLQCQSREIVRGGRRNGGAKARALSIVGAGDGALSHGAYVRQGWLRVLLLMLNSVHIPAT